MGEGGSPATPLTALQQLPHENLELYSGGGVLLQGTLLATTPDHQPNTGACVEKGGITRRPTHPPPMNLKAGGVRHHRALVADSIPMGPTCIPDAGQPANGLLGPLRLGPQRLRRPLNFRQPCCLRRQRFCRCRRHQHRPFAATAARSTRPRPKLRHSPSSGRTQPPSPTNNSTTEHAQGGLGLNS